MKKLDGNTVKVNNRTDTGGIHTLGTFGYKINWFKCYMRKMEQSQRNSATPTEAKPAEFARENTATEGTSKCKPERAQKGNVIR